MSTPKPKRPKRPADINRLAYSIVQEATRDPEAAPEPAEEVAMPETPNDAVREAAAVLGRRGGLKGGKARAEKLTPEQRAEIARKAARKRWGGSED